MKGKLHKTKEGWFVRYDQRTMQDPSAEDGMLPLHPKNASYLDMNLTSTTFLDKEIEFEIIQYDGTIPILNAWNGYAKLVDSYPVSEEAKPNSFCETPEEKCTMSYCDENGCVNRKRNLVEEPSSPTDENGNPLTYWGGLKDRTCDHTNCREVCPECQILHISQDCEAVKNWDSFVAQKNIELEVNKLAELESEVQGWGKYEGLYEQNAIKEAYINGYNKAKEFLYTKADLIDLVESLKDYTKESHTILGHDDREAIEFVDIFINEISDEEALSLAKELNKQPMKFSQTEISDEEIAQEFKNYSENWEIRQALEEGAKWYKKQNQFTISDEVLFEQATVAMEEHYGYGCKTEIDAYFRGLKWMQKQFNKKD